MSVRRVISGTALPLALALAAPAWGQEAAPVPTAPESTTVAPEALAFSADSVEYDSNAEVITALGGKLSAAGEADYSEIRGTALARFWRDLLGLTAELALEPRLAAEERLRSHSPSHHSYRESTTTEAVSGGHCAALAMGSALSRRWPSFVWMANL